MSLYFYTFDREVTKIRNLDRDEFLKELESLEARMVRDCELFARDFETPEDVRRAILAIIALKGVRADKTGSEETRELALVMRKSLLSQDMHNLFHDIAWMRYELRYGLIDTDPERAMQRRDRWKPKWNKKTTAMVHRPLRLCDADVEYIREAIGQ